MTLFYVKSNLYFFFPAEQVYESKAFLLLENLSYEIKKSHGNYVIEQLSRGYFVFLKHRLLFPCALGSRFKH
jgi:hypothetical protein